MNVSRFVTSPFQQIPGAPPSAEPVQRGAGIARDILAEVAVPLAVVGVYVAGFIGGGCLGQWGALHLGADAAGATFTAWGMAASGVLGAHVVRRAFFSI